MVLPQIADTTVPKQYNAGDAVDRVKDGLSMMIQKMMALTVKGTLVLFALLAGGLNAGVKL